MLAQSINFFLQSVALVILLFVGFLEAGVVVLELLELAHTGLHAHLHVGFAYAKLFASANFILERLMQLTLSLSMLPVLLLEIADLSVQLLEFVLEPSDFVFV